jgi:precorrin-8X/cobalt-precorrin-8 methylmutase
MKFDAYVMVDWSASSAPRTGKDSIWWCVGRWRGGRLRVDAPANSPTRPAAMDAIRARLRAMAAGRQSVLVGFDFPYAYPRGLARALGLPGEPWRAIWDELSRLVRDDQEGRTNNRFEVAAALNRRLGGRGPFWGCPAAAQCDALWMTKGTMPCGALEELRLAERSPRGPKSGWQLFYNGSAGSQALLGIPLLARLRDDPALSAVSLVWPFETGPLLPRREPRRGRVVHAEVYPSLIPAIPGPGEVKDAAQVRALVRHFAARDRSDRLGADFSAPARAGDAWREEGWILGVH